MNKKPVPSHINFADRRTPHINPKKVEAFIILFKYIVKDKGTIAKACEVVDIDRSTYYKMINDYAVTKNTGKKILIIYTQIKAKERQDKKDAQATI